MDPTEPGPLEGAGIVPAAVTEIVAPCVILVATSYGPASDCVALRLLELLADGVETFSVKVVVVDTAVLLASVADLVGTVELPKKVNRFDAMAELWDAVRLSDTVNDVGVV